jgi:hypothetical protein
MFHYATVSAVVFIEAARVVTPPDSYLSEDKELAALRDLQSKGYRFISFSPDGVYALFEKPHVNLATHFHKNRKAHA